MVSLWPFKGEDSTASFEKTLTQLSSKLKSANVRQDSYRARSRRYKVIWTLYTSLAYLLSALILVFITGWRNWGPVEYTVVSGGPVIIYSVRFLLSSYYDYRISSNQAYLDQLNKQRDAAIDKFKSATKYDSTQKLLEKYDAASKPQASLSRPNDTKARPVVPLNRQIPQRTGIAPPPTANIRRPSQALPPGMSPGQPAPFPEIGVSNPNTPSRDLPPQFALQDSPRPSSRQNSASFAPNAFDSPTTAAHEYAQARWYDRLMDVLLGEDETRASNRLALICQHCKLVNGQAPPGAKKLEDVGRWRCAECKEWNGVANEVSQLIEQVQQASPLEDGEPGPEIVDGELQESEAQGSASSAGDSGGNGEERNVDAKVASIAGRSDKSDGES